ncbi:MAG: hypothetical protein LKF89_05110 [Bacilli bacterium]|nr:hypothetical protein [Bacilli bacterium]
MCFKEIRSVSLSRFLHNDIPLCEKCLASLEPKMMVQKIEGFELTSLYEYNEAVRSLLFQFKGCFDIELKDVFLAYQLPLLKARYHSCHLVCAPSYHEKDEERGFNHVHEMFSSLSFPFIDCLKKTSDFKQALHNKRGREEISKHIIYDYSGSIEGKNIVLVDDLWTTGATALCCAKLLKTHHPKSVRILVMGKTMPHTETEENMSQEK